MEQYISQRFRVRPSPVGPSDHASFHFTEKEMSPTGICSQIYCVGAGGTTDIYLSICVCERVGKVGQERKERKKRGSIENRVSVCVCVCPCVFVCVCIHGCVGWVLAQRHLAELVLSMRMCAHVCTHWSADIFRSWFSPSTL